MMSRIFHQGKSLCGNTRIWVSYVFVLSFSLSTRSLWAEDRHISIEDVRALAAAVQELEARHGVAISYEDAPYEHAGDLQDATLLIRKDLDRFAPGHAPKILLPRVCSFKAVYEVDQNTGHPTNIVQALETIVDTFNCQELPGKFRVVVESGRICVVPEQIMGSDGKWRPTTPLLDHHIQLTVSNETFPRAMTAFYAAIGSNTSAKIVGMANAPTLRCISMVASNESARSVLVRLLDGFGLDNTRWIINYEAQPEYYGINIFPIEDPEGAGAVIKPQE